MEHPVDIDHGQGEWLTIRDAARRVGRSTKTIRRHITDGNLVAQRSGTDEKARWLISASSLFARYDEVDDPGPENPPAKTTDLARQIGNLAEMLADANRAKEQLVERAAIAETTAAHLKERLAEVRAELEAVKATPTRKERWWQSQKRS